MELPVRKQHRITFGLALAAILSLALTLGAATAPAGAGGGDAVAAKKKCKKGKKSAAAAKKKCGKSKGTTPTPASPSPPAAPLPPVQRGSLTWNDTSDLDLVVFDSAGNFVCCGNAVSIPNAFHGGDDLDGFGPERFFDRLNPSTRHFAFGVCASSDPPPGNSYSITFIEANGTSNTATGTLADFEDTDLYVPSGATNPDPANNDDWCDGGA